MKIAHIEFHPDFILPILEEKKIVTRRPLKIQPNEIIDGALIYGEEKIYISDLLCPFGSPGDIALLMAENNPNQFADSKIISIRIERLLAVMDPDEHQKEGFSFLNGFLDKWDQFYGGTIYDHKFNPFVYRIEWRIRK